MVVVDFLVSPTHVAVCVNTLGEMKWMSDAFDKSVETSYGADGP
jgi:hypothetical protein